MYLLSGRGQQVLAEEHRHALRGVAPVLQSVDSHHQCCSMLVDCLKGRVLCLQSWWA
jgi:hypothetical protein